MGLETFTREDLIQVAELTAIRTVEEMSMKLGLIPDTYTRDEILYMIGRSRYEKDKNKKFKVIKKGGKSAPVTVDKREFDKYRKQSNL